MNEKKNSNCNLTKQKSVHTGTQTSSTTATAKQQRIHIFKQMTILLGYYVPYEQPNINGERLLSLTVMIFCLLQNPACSLATSAT